ncbi:MAG: hypothetical protein KF870_03840 [Leadbetterella sp.]|nr:hypothetical protein [Leadbetterella sp.]
MLRKLIPVLLLAVLHWGCTDECTQTRTYAVWVPYTIGYETILKGISTSSPQDLKEPGKIYAYNQYLLIGEVKKGIHVIDNSDPHSPKAVSFITIPGVLDFAVKDDVLYADSYMDLVSLDLSNPLQVKELGRKTRMFSRGVWEGRSWYFDPRTNSVTDYAKEIRKETYKTNCGNEDPGFLGNYWGSGDYLSFNTGSTAGPKGDGSGQGGSMARFTLYDDFLYTVSDSDLMVFNISNPAKPDSAGKINLGWGIETIFPYEDKLFIGSNTGMYIYDNKNPAKPERMTIFNHARACDPVVVQGDRAYVTLRTGTCGTSPNQLQIINIANLYAPSLIKSYPMHSPHGLSVYEHILSLCEGENGLKSYNVLYDEDIKQLQHLRDHHAYDVIQLSSKILLVIGADGFYQYDNSNPSDLQLLSKIAKK